MHAPSIHKNWLNPARSQGRPEGVPVEPDLWGRRRAFLLLLALGLSTTLYIDLGSLGGNALRPVQFVPWVLGTMVIFFLPGGRPFDRSIAPYLILPLLYVFYLAVRHISGGPDGVLYLVKSAGNFVAYWAVVCLLIRLQKPELGYMGIVFGVFLSAAVSATGISVLGVEPQMGSGRWQGFMPGANRFGNICLLSAIPLLGAVLSRQVGRGVSAFCFFFWVVCLAGIIMSGSRAALGIAVIGHLSLYALVAISDPEAVIFWKRMLIGGFGVGVILVMIWGFFDLLPTRVIEFVREGRMSYEVYDDDARQDLHSIAYAFFREAPIVGVGMEAERFEVQHHRHGFHETSSHSTYLHLLSVSGGLGFFFFLIFPFWLVFELGRATFNSKRRITNRQKMSCIIALNVLIALGLHAITISLANSMHVWVILGIAAFVVFETSAFRRPKSPLKDLRVKFDGAGENLRWIHRREFRKVTM